MATPRRRSSRLHSVATPNHAQPTPLSKLSSLLERDESPTGAQSNIDAVVATPVAPPNSVFSQRATGIPQSAMKTPQTIPRFPFKDMHPSKVNLSTSKSMRALSSHPVNDVAQLSPSRITIAEVTESTPSKSRASLPNNMTSPVFDFSFERPESDLSVEAQKIMDSVREEAAKIKAQMMEERVKQSEHDGETNQLYGVGGRKIKKPKGKSGRFSDVHKQEFQKMDSIAHHASTWKSKVQEHTKPLLKRSPSKAGFDEITPKSIPKSKSMRSLHFDSIAQMDNSSPGKRLKRDLGDDASSARPVSRGKVNSTQITPKGHEYTSKLPSAVSTPTKASLARSASIKNLNPSKLPSLCRSASTKTLRKPDLDMPKTEGSNKYAASLSRFGGSVKSILRHAQPKYSEDPQKLAAGTHLPLPKATFDLEKDLPSLPSSPIKPTTQQTPTIKRVNFTESTATEYPKLAASPSISKIPKPQSAKSAQNQTCNIAPVPSKDGPEEQIAYPLLATSPNITTRRPISKPTTPGDFTFRANKDIKFGNDQVTSPGGTTIRIVRPSGFPTPVPSTFDLFPSIPHGMTNKKRKHDAETEDEDIVEEGMDENKEPDASAGDQEDGGEPRAKKRRIQQMVSYPSIEAQVTNQSPLKRRFVNRGGKGGSGIAKKGGMSLARLTALARPKDRR